MKGNRLCLIAGVPVWGLGAMPGIEARRWYLKPLWDDESSICHHPESGSRCLGCRPGYGVLIRECRYSNLDIFEWWRKFKAVCLAKPFENGCHPGGTGCEACAVPRHRQAVLNWTEVS